MKDIIATISGRLAGSFCIALLCGVPIAVLTSTGFWDSVGVVTFAMFAFLPVD